MPQKKGQGQRDGSGRAGSLAVNEADKSEQQSGSLSAGCVEKTQTQEKNATLFGRWSCKRKLMPKCVAACVERNNWVPWTIVP